MRRAGFISTKSTTSARSMHLTKLWELTTNMNLPCKGRFHRFDGIGNLKSAEKEFRAILDLDEKSLLGLNGMGAVYFSQARYAEATKILRRVVEADPKNPLWYTNLARAVVRQEDFPKPRRRPFEGRQF